jgi:hypothetical protein
MASSHRPCARSTWPLATCAGLLAALGECKFYTGSIEEMIPLQERAIRLSPRDPFIGNWYQRIGVVHLLQSCIEEAIVWSKRHAAPIWDVRRLMPISLPPMPSKARQNRPAAELAEARRLSGDNRYSSIAHLKAAQYEAPYSGALCLVPPVAAGRRSHWHSTAQPSPACLALRGATPGPAAPCDLIAVDEGPRAS